MRGKTRPCSACPFWRDCDCTVRGVRRMATAPSCAIGRKEMHRRDARERARRVRADEKKGRNEK